MSAPGTLPKVYCQECGAELAFDPFARWGCPKCGTRHFVAVRREGVIVESLRDDGPDADAQDPGPKESILRYFYGPRR